jgi:tetratricopeptide (TPR) repeat protein
LGWGGHRSADRRFLLVGSLTGLGCLLLTLTLLRADEPPRPVLTAEEKARLEAEATNQSTEADRLFKQGEFAAALPLYEAELTSRARLGDRRYEAYAARAIGCCHDRLGNLDAAIAAWKAARTIDAKRDDRGFEGYDLFLIGHAELRLGKPEEAVGVLEQALPRLSQAIDRDHEADARLVLARGLTVLGRAEEAAPHLDRAQELARSLNDAKRLADALAESGRVALALDDPGPAAEWLTDAAIAYTSQNLAAEASEIARLLGEAFLALELPETAAARVEEAAKEHQRLNDRASLADDLQFLAALSADRGDLPAARDLARRVVAAYHEADNPPGEIDARVRLARIESLLDDWSAASATLAEALKLVRVDGPPADQVRLMLLAADVALKARQVSRTDALLDEAERVARDADNGALTRLVADARKRLR